MKRVFIVILHFAMASLLNAQSLKYHLVEDTISSEGSVWIEMVNSSSQDVYVSIGLDKKVD